MRFDPLTGQLEGPGSSPFDPSTGTFSFVSRTATPWPAGEYYLDLVDGQDGCLSFGLQVYGERPGASAVVYVNSTVAGTYTIGGNGYTEGQGSICPGAGTYTVQIRVGGVLRYTNQFTVTFTGVSNKYKSSDGVSYFRTPTNGYYNQP